MENSRERNLEFGLFALAFGLALSIRLLRLGELPLSDGEARLALQALDLSKGLHPVMSPQPAYIVLTALTFFIIQTSNFAARLVPALFGAGLSLAPFHFRDRLGRKPAIILAFFLALDPGYLALSRIAGSPIIGVAALLFACSAWQKSRSWAGFWVGVALLSGPMLWPGVLGLAVTYGFLRTIIKHDIQPAGEPSEQRKSLTRVAIFAGSTYVILGSLFLLATGGLSAGLAAIPAYFGGWLDFTDVPASRLLIGLASYEFLALFLAIASLVRGILKRDKLIISLGLWLTVALVLALVYPSRQVADLAWALIPLLTLAALEISSYLAPIQDGKWETLGMAAFTSAVLIFIMINFSAIALAPAEPTALQLRWWLLLGSLALLIVSIAMVAFGWSIPTAVQGSLWGTLLVLIVLSISTSMASAELRTYHTVEMWPGESYTGQAGTLVSQINDLSRWKAGINRSLDVTLLGIDSPALHWALRDWPISISPGTNLTGSNPSIVITSDQFSSPEIETAYRGQGLTWHTDPAWEQGTGANWLRWSILHDFPQMDGKIILWVRNDIFIDNQNNQ